MEQLEYFIRELRNRNYAYNTIKTYKHQLKNYLYFCSRIHNKEPQEIIASFLNEFNSHEQRRIAYNTILAYYRFVIEHPCPYKLRRQRKRKRLPKSISRNDILKILYKISNQKHRLMIGLMYSAGLRVSEVIKIKISDLNLNKLTLYVHNSKNHKDRITIISEIMEDSLKTLIKDRDKSEHLFLNKYGKPYTVRTLQKVFHKALQKSSINKQASCHTLRHSFATHLLENNYSLPEIQRLLGHKNVTTTMIYLHLAEVSGRKVISPL